MKVYILTGSSKGNNSVSGKIVETLEKSISTDNTNVIKLTKGEIRSSDFDINTYKDISESGILILVFPMYNDSIPSHILHWMVQAEKSLKNENLTVYAIINMGFHEATYGKLVFEILENWCIRAGFKWGYGIGFGAGPVLQSINLNESFLGKKIYNEICELGKIALQKKAKENSFISPLIPKRVYKFMGNRMLKKIATSIGEDENFLGRKIEYK